jgi:hypothetical protein
MIARRSYSLVYKVQRIILMVFYTISMMALSIPLARFVNQLSPDHLYPLVATLILYMVLVVILGGVVHTISYIPFNLAAAFDPIRNDIASGEIRDLAMLGERITRFMVEFYDFTFLDIAHAFIHTEQGGPVSHEDLSDAIAAMEEFGMLEMSRTLKEISRAGKVAHEGKEFHLYILPIRFGNRWLGYMGLLSGSRISRFALHFLAEFENNFLDDQIMHVIPKTEDR